MTVSPLDRAFDFWKLLVDLNEWDGLAQYRDWGERPSRGIHAIRTESEARSYQLIDGGAQSLLFAAVHPIQEPPESSEVLAEIRDEAGNPYSYVLWFPEQRCAMVPFDPNSAIRSLQFEEYMSQARATVLPPSILSAYYAVRPLIPVALKLRLRRLLARGSDPTEHALSWPTDRSLDLLLLLLLRLILMVLNRDSLPFLWFWPERRPWAAVLTHDVETEDGLGRVGHVMDLESGRGLRSSFNLVPRDYDVRGSFVANVQDAGFEIGVHGYTHDGLMFAKWSTFLDRVVTVNECGRRWGASGFRSPATYRNLEWFHMLEFEYDSSVTDTAPFEPQPGGCASLFPFLVGRIVELPMTMPQDHTLFGLLGQSDAQVWLSKLEQIRDSNGMACVLTHPDSGAGYIGSPDNEARYAEVLDFVAGSDAWTPLPRDLARWWRARSAADPRCVDQLQGVAFGRAELDSTGRLVIAAPSTL